MTKEECLKKIKEEEVKFLQCWFVDVFGDLKRLSICGSEIENVLSDGVNIDGSSIKGFTGINNSDLVAVPDLKTFRMLPWKADAFKTGVVICDIYNTDFTPFESCPRNVLKRQLKKASDLGYDFYVGPELEYFYFKNKDMEAVDETGYFDGFFQDVCEEVREKTVLTLEEMGIRVECHHHEVAPGQHEISMKYDEALAMADKVIYYKAVVKEIANEYNLKATFMPKPLFGENGSGMHVHQSLFKDGKNAFCAEELGGLSVVAKSYVAGLLEHAPAFTAVCNPSLNSYKRLVPGFEAPVYLAWAKKNRSALIRVPAYKEENKNACRIELRSADPSSNPYLAFSVMLGSGLDGIEKGGEGVLSVEDDIFAMSDEEREERGIKSLPGSLGEALKVYEKSDLMRSVLGEDLFEYYLEEKLRLWKEYSMHVSGFELGREF